MSTGRRIAKNAGMLMTSQLTTWVLTLVLTIFLPRYLGASAVGKLNLATSLWAIAAIVIAFGLDTLLTKEIARQPEHTTDLLGNTLVLRIGLYLIAFVVMIAYVQLVGYPAETAAVIFIIGVSVVVWQCLGAVQAALQGLEQMHYMSIGNIAGKGVNTVVCITLLLLGQSVYVIAAVSTLAALVSFSIQVYFLNRLQRVRLAFDRREAVHLLRRGLPYLMSGFFLVVYMQVDIVIISWLVDERTIGWYGAADLLFGTLLFIPTVFMAAIFPSLSRMYASGGTTDLTKLMRKSFDLLLVLSIPIGLGILVVADPLVVLLFGPDFAGSGPILALLGIVLIFTYQNMLVGQFLISTDRQNVWTIVMGIATIATVPIDLVVIPWCLAQFGNGAIGGAISFIITEAAMLIIGLRLLPKGSLGRSNVSTALRASLAGGLMVAATWWARPYFIGLPIAIGMVVYSAAVLILRVVPKDDLELFKSLALNVLKRFKRGEPAAKEA
jgi:O-antigen/teichoic acid export membrane protein